MRILVALGVAFATLSSTFVERLDVDHQPFRRDFENSHARARLVAILSPT
jgi:hypothetical protein